MKYELDENDGKTRVRYSYNGFSEMDDSYANMNFSSAKYLESLRQFCQKGVGEAFGSKIIVLNFLVLIKTYLYDFCIIVNY